MSAEQRYLTDQLDVLFILAYFDRELHNIVILQFISPGFVQNLIIVEQTNIVTTALLWLVSSSREMSTIPPDVDHDMLPTQNWYGNIA